MVKLESFNSICACVALRASDERIRSLPFKKTYDWIVCGLLFFRVGHFEFQFVCMYVKFGFSIVMWFFVAFFFFFLSNNHFSLVFKFA